MRRSVSIRLRDMAAAIDAVQEMVDGLAIEAYRNDVKLRFAVERAIQIISEASRHIPIDSKGRFPAIPWPAIAAIGNRLRHEYHQIDDEILWKIATVSLVDLKRAVVQLLAEHEEEN